MKAAILSITVAIVKTLRTFLVRKPYYREQINLDTGLGLL